ncbi:UPF0202 protein [Smittium mucronatum]|uniref:RNA cytidine acetyltransferase n=1 Tax=Smittium mucronatum TaxID=133383 RepID=A0A1R0H4L8_9FUNG|nr:UPF0202 protein [Smittium mucronatum]
MVKKAVDPRINFLIRNGVTTNHRSFFVLIGDRGKDQIVNLHWMLTQAKVTNRPNVLWCYKKDLGFTSHRKKREAKIKREIKKGIREPNKEDPFEMFITLTDIRYTYYKESENILGNTFETVEGGGIIVLLLKSMKSLKQLYTLTMDVHSRYRTEAHNDVVGRFNERFILSLAGNKDCLFIDDELNVLPISEGRSVKALPESEKNQVSERKEQLEQLKKSLQDTEPIGSLIKLTKTYDQAKVLMQFADTIGGKNLRSTVSLTAGRGRGKSAALGLSLACAIAHGYSNIFVTSPSPSNLKTLFEFLFKGFDALGYEEHLDYDIIMSNGEQFEANCVIRVNIFKQHRQTIQYIIPQDSHTLSQAELLVIDEAAAIPLPLVNKLLGPYLVFMASTINGYEGTGRSLSLKLIKQLREQSVSVTSTGGDDGNKVVGGGRQLKELTLTEPIRYSINDNIESWLNSLLCLDASVVTKNISGCPHPDKCDLYWVNRDTLFSYHPVSEAFLQKMIALYVASHYKNSPNDLQLMSDAPAHELFVLLAPVDTASNKTTLPEPLCVIQVALEGQISKESLLHSLSRGTRSGGDLIPWLVAQQYQDDEFAGLSGARVVRIATHPDYSGMGYGSKALQLLEDYYSGKFISISENEDSGIPKKHSLKRVTDSDFDNMKEEDKIDTDIKIRDLSVLPPLFLRLSENPPASLHWLGTSYGLTNSLFKFWKRGGFSPVYLRLTESELTGEHTVVMLKSLTHEGYIQDGFSKEYPESKRIENSEWLGSFSFDFVRRMLSLYGYEFSKFPSVLGLSILEAASLATKSDGVDRNVNSFLSLTNKYTIENLSRDFLPFDIKRLESYSNNVLDYHVILDLLPKLANLYFSFPSVKSSCNLSGVQQCVLLGIGLQRKSIDVLVGELGLNSSVLMAMLMKIVKKFVNFMDGLQSESIESSLPRIEETSGKSMPTIVKKVKPGKLTEILSKDMAMDDGVVEQLKLGRYKVTGDETEFEQEALKIQKLNEPNLNTVISLKSTLETRETEELDGDIAKPKKKRGKGGKNSLVVTGEGNGDNEEKSSKKSKSHASAVEKLVASEEKNALKNKKVKMSKKTRIS